MSYCVVSGCVVKEDDPKCFFALAQGGRSGLLQFFPFGSRLVHVIGGLPQYHLYEHANNPLHQFEGHVCRRVRSGGISSDFLQHFWVLRMAVI